LKTIFIIFFLSLISVTQAQTSSRSVVKFNTGWQFIKGDTANSNWKKINIPHTWNIADVMDDEPGYYRGAGWYKKIFTIPAEYKNKKLSLYFEGANQETKVFINGKPTGEHIGGYTGFNIPLTNIKFNGTDELIVKVDNSFNEAIPPLTADFTFYGGMYRNVFLVVTNNIHFANESGSNSVFITTPSVSKEQATTGIKAIVVNESAIDTKLTITSIIKDHKGRKISEVVSNTTVNSLSKETITQKLPVITSPHLWSPEDPYLYSVETKITDEKNKVIDVIKNPLGFRWFSFDAAKGFMLNGSPYKLIGASRHQDFKDLGNAVPDNLAIKDVVLLKQMGANFLRVAHYPQDPVVLKTCDSLGLLTSVEIPVVNEITESTAFYNNCEQMQLEMIRQNYNHPSVIMWCYMNEVLLRPHFANDKEKQKIYFSNVAALAKRLDSLTRAEDPFRYTMMINHGSYTQYKNVGLLEIPMVVGWNLYQGWYGGTMKDFPVFLDDFHKNYPAKPFLITEYGADADPRIHSSQPIRFDKSVEYTTLFHQFYLTEMLKRFFVAGAIIWNLADFNSETRNETMPHINNKGLLEWNRTPKDPYYYYQAMLSKKPFIKILGMNTDRYGSADSIQMVSTQVIQVVSNLAEVSITANGKFQSGIKITNGLGEITLPLKAGMNTIIVEGTKDGKLYKDNLKFHLHVTPRFLNGNFSQLNILLGGTRHFLDSKNQWWQPDHVYEQKGWGSIGGKKFKVENNSRLPYGTDKNIISTDDDPIYQTQQTGIREYKFNVPPGKYELTLHFAELIGGNVNGLPYNLDNNSRTEKTDRRIFNVKVNDQLFLDHFNIAEQYGIAKAVTKKLIVTIENNHGINISFEAIEGEPILNAIQIKPGLKD
jgi:beta-galactosidase